MFTIQSFCVHVFCFNKNRIVLRKRISFRKAWLSSGRRTVVLPSNHIQFLKGSQRTTENPFWDYFLFESSTSYFLLLECAVSPPCEAGAGSDSAWLFPAAELRGLHHVMLPVACYSWPKYLIYFYGAFFWNKKKKKTVLGAIIRKTWGGSGVSLGECWGSHQTPMAGVSNSGPVSALWSYLRPARGQGTNGVYIMTPCHLAFALTARFRVGYWSSLSLRSLSSANGNNTPAGP